MKKEIVTLWMMVVLSTSAMAYMVDASTQKSARDWLQVGAFSKIESMKPLQKRFSKFPLVYTKEGGLYRLFVLLPAQKGTRRWLIKKVRETVPGAFIKQNVSGRTSVREHRSDFHEPLDARAILRARKKFF